MPIYRIAPRANVYEGLDIPFYAQQLQARQAKDDQTRAMWSKMVQDNANIEYLDDATRQKVINEQNARFSDVLEKHKGNLAAGYSDILGAVEATKTDPYWNLNKRHVEEMAKQSELERMYGADYINTSQGLGGTPLFDQTTGKYRSASGIQSGALKADDYSTNLENQLRDLAPMVSDITGPLTVAPNNPGYTQQIRERLRMLSPDQLKAISSDPSVQATFLANNATALKDTRALSGGRGTYADMFGNKDKLAEWIYGNIQDKAINESIIDNNIQVDQYAYLAAQKAASGGSGGGKGKGKGSETGKEEAEEGLINPGYTDIVDLGFIVPAESTKLDKSSYENMIFNFDKTTRELNETNQTIESVNSEVANLGKMSGKNYVSENINGVPLMLQNPNTTQSDLLDPVGSAFRTTIVDPSIVINRVLNDPKSTEFEKKSAYASGVKLNNLYSNKRLQESYNEAFKAAKDAINESVYKEVKSKYDTDEFKELQEKSGLNPYEFKQAVMTGIMPDGKQVALPDRNIQYQSGNSNVSYNLPVYRAMQDFNTTKETLIEKGDEIRLTGESYTRDFSNKNSWGYKINESINKAITDNPVNSLNWFTGYNGEKVGDELIDLHGKKVKVSDAIADGYYTLERSGSSKGNQMLTLVPTKYGISTQQKNNSYGIKKQQLGFHQMLPDNSQFQSQLHGMYLGQLAEAAGSTLLNEGKQAYIEEIYSNMAMTNPVGRSVLNQVEGLKAAIDAGKDNLDITIRADENTAFRYTYVNGQLYLDERTEAGYVVPKPITLESMELVPLIAVGTKMFGENENANIILNYVQEGNTQIVNRDYKGYGAGYKNL